MVEPAEEHGTLPKMLPEGDALVVDGQLYTIGKWQMLVKEKDNFKEEEKQQLKKLYRHYEAFYDARKKKEALEKINHVKNIADEVGVDLEQRS